MRITSVEGQEIDWFVEMDDLFDQDPLTYRNQDSWWLFSNMEAIQQELYEILKRYCEQINPRQKTKRHRNCNWNGAAINSTAFSEHNDWQNKAKYCNVCKFYTKWPKKTT